MFRTPYEVSSPHPVPIQPKLRQAVNKVSATSKLQLNPLKPHYSCALPTRFLLLTYSLLILHHISPYICYLHRLRIKVSRNFCYSACPSIIHGIAISNCFCCLCLYPALASSIATGGRNGVLRLSYSITAKEPYSYPSLCMGLS
ncbi:hypothetical protein SODALDRAFT_63832 [Sodiomyces alkalinus F11]|uniref:Uncharacterized protein n=1 Tax=Sodiomyces alkalinus (strain CBS 110278 / VKM F-3762 / F11) TaxID=1314773 RepID=A0A3N2PLF3_SODAK|nr:hypothetical protein SODALDRAFT_63832 [Sodiomyces alkalinus F11]ROT35371.1 hypothetical protein SODALDRAFT_63832 [Sodiomyces alkalinus F11]